MNYLGENADVLENKSPRAVLEHLGPLAAVQLFDDDHQLKELLHYQPEQEAEALTGWLASHRR